MTDEQIELKLYRVQDNKGCCDDCFGELARTSLDYINRLKSSKQLAETKLQELLENSQAKIKSQEQFAKKNGFTPDCTPYYIAVEYKKRFQKAETQLRDLLSALYQRTDNDKDFTLYRKDVVELAKDYGIKEEELK